MPRTLVPLLAVLLAFVLFAPALADDGDAVTLSRSAARVGERIPLHMEVVTPKGATVEIQPGAPAWNRVEVVQTIRQASRDDGDRTVHSLDLLIAPFLTGDVTFSPVLTISQGSTVATRVMPQATINVAPVLSPTDELKLSPLAPPVAISGGESPLLRPAIVLGIAAAVLLLVLALVMLVRRLLRRFARPVPTEPGIASAPPLAGIEHLLATDPVAAYRKLAAIVRSHLANTYEFPAPSLTTLELQARMEGEGVDRWQARLVGGLLEECDAVVYAGYRPAAERRAADLTMAREIVEASV